MVGTYAIGLFAEGGDPWSMVIIIKFARVYTVANYQDGFSLSISSLSSTLARIADAGYRPICAHWKIQAICRCEDGYPSRKVNLIAEQIQFQVVRSH